MTEWFGWKASDYKLEDPGPLAVFVNNCNCKVNDLTTHEASLEPYFPRMYNGSVG